MRKPLTITLSLFFLAAGLIPARTLHYCRMLDRATEGDCGVCQEIANHPVAQKSCCAAASALSDDFSNHASDARDSECCSLRIQGPFAAAAAGHSDGVIVQTTAHDALLLATAPVPPPVDLNLSRGAELFPDNVRSAIATLPAHLTGSGFLC